jgi:hypothetical protein
MPQDNTQTTPSYSQRRRGQNAVARFRHGTLQTVQTQRAGKPIGALVFCSSRSVDPPLLFADTPCVKVVGKRRTSEDLTPISPEEALRRAVILQAQTDLLNPYPRPRGFVFKARTREDYERWRKAQSNPRLW